MAGSFRKEFPASCFMCKEGWDTTFKLREVPFRRPYDCAGTHRHDRHRRQLHAPSCRQHRRGRQDRKSTRLNSSHQIISYAVFCLKKKKEHTTKLLTRAISST